MNMNRYINKTKNLWQTGCLALCSMYTSSLFAAAEWFPKAPSADDMSTGGKSAMDIAANYVKKGMGIILFITCVMMFIKFITTVAHGIEESKKSEGGSVTTFGSYTVMAIIYLAMSIATGYVGYSVITKFAI